VKLNRAAELRLRSVDPGQIHAFASASGSSTVDREPARLAE
jgi:hypothetical protein